MTESINDGASDKLEKPQNKSADDPQKVLTTFSIKATQVVSLQDPIDPEGRHYYAFASVKNIPKGIKHFNVRSPNITSKLYRKVIADLMDRSKTFHLNNRGMILLAESVNLKGNTMVIDLGKSGGLMDGGRTDKIIQVHGDSAPDDQYVCVQVRVGVPRSKHTDMATGLNSSHQVQLDSIMNFNGDFNPIHATLKKQPYYERIAFQEGDKKNGAVAIATVIRHLAALNVNLWPIRAHSGKKRAELGIAKNSCEPTLACSGSNSLLEAYDRSMDHFDDMIDLLPEVLLLRDYIEANAISIYNKGLDGMDKKRGGYLPFVSRKSDGNGGFVKTPQAYSGQMTYYTLHKGVIYPLLGAMRPFIKRKDGKLVFDGGLEGVKKAFDKVAFYLIDNLATRYKGKSDGDRERAVHEESKKPGIWRDLLNVVLVNSK